MKVNQNEETVELKTETNKISVELPIEQEDIRSLQLQGPGAFNRAIQNACVKLLGTAVLQFAKIRLTPQEDQSLILRADLFCLDFPKDNDDNNGAPDNGSDTGSD